MTTRNFLPVGLFFVAAALPSLGGCDGCGTAPATEDAGTPPGPTDGGGSPIDAGPRDAGSGPLDSGAPLDAGLRDAGAPPVVDAGRFDWQDLFGEAGVPDELACIPGTLPDLTGGVTGILNALNLTTYSGSPETGVVCGATTCAAEIPCCVLCGYAQCAEVDGDGGASCPAFTATFSCDGKEDCDGEADTCCFSLSGTECRKAEDCVIDLSFGDGGFNLFNDGGFVNPFADAGYDAGSDEDAGVAIDAGVVIDAGAADGGDDDAGTGVDAGDAGIATDAGPPPISDAGAPADLLGPILDQGVRVCHRTIEFIDPTCDLFSGEVCCTSDNFVSVDLGLCVPLLLCAGGGI